MTAIIIPFPCSREAIHTTVHTIPVHIFSTNYVLFVVHTMSFFNILCTLLSNKTTQCINLYLLCSMVSSHVFHWKILIMRHVLSYTRFLENLFYVNAPTIFVFMIFPLFNKFQWFYSGMLLNVCTSKCIMQYQES